jgi:hypothetical protein
VTVGLVEVAPRRQRGEGRAQPAGGRRYHWGEANYGGERGGLTW